jgi:uroporphyrinogen-III synthase
MLKQQPMAGRTVGVQLDGDDPNLAMMNFLKDAGAFATPVSPYRYAPAADALQVAELIKQMSAGQVNAMTFTSSTQVRRMRDVAKEHKLEAELDAGLKQTVIASIGPIATKELEAQGVRVDVQPKRSFFLKPLVKELEIVLEKNSKSK